MGVTSVRQGVAVVREPGGQDQRFEQCVEKEKDPEAQLKPRALAVDDSADIAFMLAMTLQSAGYETVMSTSAIEALALAELKHFDLVVSDIAMPDMDGYSLAKALRSRPEYEQVPLVAVTGFDQYDDRQRALAAGFNTHIKKPIDPDSFISLVRKLVS